MVELADRVVAALPEVAEVMFMEGCLVTLETFEVVLDAVLVAFIIGDWMVVVLAAPEVEEFDIWVTVKFPVAM